MALYNERGLKHSGHYSSRTTLMPRTSKYVPFDAHSVCQVIDNPCDINVIEYGQDLASFINKMDGAMIVVETSRDTHITKERLLYGNSLLCKMRKASQGQLIRIQNDYVSIQYTNARAVVKTQSPVSSSSCAGGLKPVSSLNSQNIGQELNSCLLRLTDILERTRILAPCVIQREIYNRLYNQLKNFRSVWVSIGKGWKEVFTTSPEENDDGKRHYFLIDKCQIGTPWEDLKPFEHILSEFSRNANTVIRKSLKEQGWYDNRTSSNPRFLIDNDQLKNWVLSQYKDSLIRCDEDDGIIEDDDGNTTYSDPDPRIIKMISEYQYIDEDILDNE